MYFRNPGFSDDVSTDTEEEEEEEEEEEDEEEDEEEEEGEENEEMGGAAEEGGRGGSNNSECDDTEKNNEDVDEDDALDVEQSHTPLSGFEALALVTTNGLIGTGRHRRAAKRAVSKLASHAAHAVHHKKGSSPPPLFGEPGDGSEQGNSGADIGEPTGGDDRASVEESETEKRLKSVHHGVQTRVDSLTHKMTGGEFGHGKHRHQAEGLARGVDDMLAKSTKGLIGTGRHRRAAKRKVTQMLSKTAHAVDSARSLSHVDSAFSFSPAAAGSDSLLSSPMDLSNIVLPGGLVWREDARPPKIAPLDLKTITLVMRGAVLTLEDDSTAAFHADLFEEGVTLIALQNGISPMTTANAVLLGECE